MNYRSLFFVKSILEIYCLLKGADADAILLYQKTSNHASQIEDSDVSEMKMYFAT
jgi:hypothetical protein